MKYVCEVCGYVYDPAVGDPDSGIEPGTAFEDIPDDWVCPICNLSGAPFKAPLLFCEKVMTITVIAITIIDDIVGGRSQIEGNGRYNFL